MKPAVCIRYVAVLLLWFSLLLIDVNFITVVFFFFILLLVKVN